ncbi:hypothetical protein NZL82_17685 [Sphingomonas sanguinis]|uniref:hypothetical protein n=1 Tax=Sphingomonas sp. LC-1 TaxID=3110957 RepID=UPI0021BB4DD2|nr:hypothetical protein [Sphingomonas sp. LC-1]MCT8003707.1 hypothetical protein [Sphingomonas sp. LC-1]
MADKSDGQVTLSLGRVAVHVGVAILVCVSVTIMLERYGHLPHWMVVNNARGRSFVWLIGLSLGLLARRMLNKVFPVQGKGGA